MIGNALMATNRVLSVFCLLLSAVPLVGASPMSERDVLILGITGNTRMRLLRMDERSDSLDLAQVRTGRLPGIDLGVSGTVTPVDSSYLRAGSVLIGDNAPRFSLSGSADIRQVLPGGGTVSAGIGKTAGGALDSASTQHATDFSVGISQPLMRGGWSDAPLERAIKIQLLDNQGNVLRRKKEVAGILSELRSKYWGLYEAQKQLSIRSEELAFQEKQLAYERRRFALGATAEIDTLTSALELLRARQNLLGAEKGSIIAARNLAQQLGSDSSVEVSLDTEVGVDELPPAEEFLSGVRAYDPQAEIFSLMRQKLDIQLRNARTGLLPDLTLGARYSRSLGDEKFWPEPQTFASNAVISLVMNYSLPLTGRKVSTEKLRESGKRADIEEQEYQRNLRKGIDELILSWDQERANLSVMEASRAIAEKKLRAAESGYAAGTVDQLTLIKAQNDFTDISLQLVRTRISLKLLEVTFDELTGRVLTKFGMDVL